jgi:hypothetical protein
VSDHLHQAVQAEIAAHTPILPPSFDALKARKHARDRRRTLSAVAASALAVAGITLVPSAFLGGEGPTPAQVAGDAPSAELLAFHIKATDAKTVLAGGPGSHEAVSRCTQLPGLSDTGVMYSYPAQYAGRVFAGEDADRLAECVEAVPGWGVTFTRVADGAEESKDEVPAAVAARFDAEAANHGVVEDAVGCTIETARERLAVEQARQKDTGAPIDGWLLEAPPETRLYVCRYTGTFQGRSGTALAVWEAADAAAGGPRPALEFQAA